MPMNEIDELLKRKLEDGREFRDMEMRAAEDDGDDRVVEGYATTFNDEYLLWSEPDYRVYEKVDRNAFDGCDMSDVIMQYDHEGRVFARMSNRTLTCNPDERGLRIRAMLGGTEIGRELYQEIKGGYTTKMSIGFTVKTQERTEERDEDAGKTVVHRKITGVKKLYDVSAVSLPANDATEISARNFGEGVIAEIEKERLASLERKRKIQIIKIMMEV